MADPARRLPTYEDVLAAPEHLVAEILDGELVLSPRPAPRHSRAATVLGGVLGSAFDHGSEGPGGWWILFEPELHLEAPSTPIVPDLAGWRVERLPNLPDEPWFTVAPDWVCEVLSPSTAARDRAVKLGIYAAAGVGHVWLVDPTLQTLEVLQRQAATWLVVAVHRGEERVTAPPFEAAAWSLGVLWGRPRSAPRGGAPPASTPG